MTGASHLVALAVVVVAKVWPKGLQAEPLVPTPDPHHKRKALAAMKQMLHSVSPMPVGSAVETVAGAVVIAPGSLLPRMMEPHPKKAGYPRHPPVAVVRFAPPRGQPVAAVAELLARPSHPAAVVAAVPTHYRPFAPDVANQA